MKRDWTKIAGIYPIMNPPVGPVRTAAPDLKLENTGRPANPNIIYRIIEIVALTGPKIVPIKYNAKVPKVIGTIPIGTEIGDKTHMSAVATAINARSLIFIQMKLYLSKHFLAIFFTFLRIILYSVHVVALYLAIMRIYLLEKIVNR